MAPLLSLTADGMPVRNDDDAIQIGRALAQVLRKRDDYPHVVVGKNTAPINYWVEHFVTGALLKAGVRVTQTGPLPVPAVARLTPSMRADLGLFISGTQKDAVVRLFDGSSKMLTESFAENVLSLLSGPALSSDHDLVTRFAKNTRIEDAQGRYIEMAKAEVPRGDNHFDTLRAVIDCANGASYRVAQPAIHELGVEVIAYGVDPRGKNLEVDCGFHEPRLLRERVREKRADVGFAFNGNGDRMVTINKNLEIIPEERVVQLIGSFLERPAPADPLVRALLLLYLLAAGGQLTM